MRYVTSSALFLSYLLMGVGTVMETGRLKIIFDEKFKGEPLPAFTAFVMRMSEGGLFSPLMAISLLFAAASASWHFYDCVQDEKNNSKNACTSFSLSLGLLLLLVAFIALALSLPLIPNGPQKL